VALEAGYRGQVSDRLLVDGAAFLQRYDRLRSNEPELPYTDGTTTPPHLVVPFRVGNGLKGRIFGGELALSWQQTERWRVQGWYSYLDMDLWPGPDSQDRETEDSEEDAVPRHQLGLRSQAMVRPGLELGISGRYASRLQYQGIDPYLTADLYLRWRPGARLELALLGESLLDSPHLEYVSRSSHNLPAWTTREVSATLGWRF
jgi:iron complex outermembrane receptor protein